MYVHSNFTSQPPERQPIAIFKRMHPATTHDLQLTSVAAHVNSPLNQKLQSAFHAHSLQPEITLLPGATFRNLIWLQGHRCWLCNTLCGNSALEDENQPPESSIGSSSQHSQKTKNQSPQTSLLDPLFLLATLRQYSDSIKAHSQVEHNITSMDHLRAT